MSSFTVAKGKAPLRPPHVLVLSPGEFVETWPGRPRADVAVGLVRVCDAARQAAAAAATSYVRSAFVVDGALVDPDVASEEWTNVFMREAMASAMTDPNDVTKPYFPAANDVIGRALPAETIARVWSEYHRFVRRTDATAPAATDAEVARLARLLAAGRMSSLASGLGVEVRRLLFWCLEQLGPDDAPGATTPAAPADDDGDGVYVVRSA